jgi:hypothetical protein
MAVSPVQGHNWLEGTRGRAAFLGASQFCSPTYPQLDPNKIHVQVAKNQPFAVEWAAAHTDYTYIIVIPEAARANVSMLTRAFMDAYLKNCSISNFANITAPSGNPSYPRSKFHRFNRNFNLSSMQPVNDATALLPNYQVMFDPTPIISGPIWNAFGNRSNSFFLPGDSPLRVATSQQGMYQDMFILPWNNSLNPEATNSILAQYRPQYMLNDQRCDQPNPMHPWIEHIARFQHHDASRTFATALMHIPGRAGSGRYQVHYKWSSYCDVLDVDVPAAPTPVANPYGTIINGGTPDFVQGHHCWFENPFKIGQAVEVVTDTEQCAALCRYDGSCKGYQLIPLQLNPTVSGDIYGQFSKDGSFIPWMDNMDATATNMSRANRTQFLNKNIPAVGAMICYTLIQFQNDFNSARPLWSFTEDMDHQGFYGTCYIKDPPPPQKPMQFQTFPTIQLPVDKKYRFLSMCIDCSNVAMNKTTPRWDRTEYCVDCDAKPKPGKVQNIPAWTAVGSGTFTEPAHWLSPGGSPYALEDECKLLALRDPQCSKFVMYSDLRAQMLLNLTAPLSRHQVLVNGTTIQYLQSNNGYYYNNRSISLPYFRTCACLDKTTNNTKAGFTPDLDPTSFVMACGAGGDLVVNASCTRRGFNVFKLP